MAEFIPDRLPSRATKGEERTFNLLKKLPDDYLVYYEPHIENRHPDFVVIAPDLGVIVIEVKGWYFDDIIRGTDSEITIIRDNRPKTEIHPLEQARGYKLRLMNACQKNPKKSAILHQNGPHKNKFIFPFCHFVILSNITQDQFHRFKEQDFSAIFRPENTMTREKLIELDNATPDQIREHIKKYFDPFWNITPLTSDQVDVLRSIIHPEIILSYLPSKPSPKIDESKVPDLKVLDRRQENNSRKIGEGHRIIYGVAGSGKTILLLARSKLLHDRDSGARILLLCYNVVLGAYLKGALEKYPRINVFHFDGWAIHNGIHRFFDPITGKGEKDESLGARLLEQLKRREGDFRKYDAILIDEAQDFDPSWFSCILEAMKEPNDGDLLIVCDGNQGIRPIGSVSWKSLGIKAVGRTLHQALDLDRNYRNTREILQLASHFASKEVTNDEDSINIIPVYPAQAIRNGPKPILIQCKDHRDECQRICNIINMLLEGSTFNDINMKLLPEEIGILYRKKPFRNNEIFREFLHELSTTAPITWLNEDSNSRSKVFNPGIKVQTVDSSKGLQYRVVFIMWADLFDPNHQSDEYLESRRLYVALTRAEDGIIITYSKTNSFIQTMINSGDVDHKQII